MRVVEAGRFVHEAGALAPRRYLEQNLLSIHSRGLRLKAIAGGVRAGAEEREIETLEAVRLVKALDIARDTDWLLLRDYSATDRDRSVLFLFRGNQPLAVVKVRSLASGGTSLSAEADALRAITPVLDDRLRTTVPVVLQFVVTAAHELLVLSALPGRSLAVSMQRSLRPRAQHAPHLIAAGQWLGRFHRCTRTATHGDFWPRNILFTERGEVSGVVDWEHASTHGLRWDDVFLLPLLYATDAPAWRAVDRRREFRRAFTGRGVLPDAIEAYFRAYAAEAGVDRAIVEAELARYLRARHPQLFDVYSGVG